MIEGIVDLSHYTYNPDYAAAAAAGVTGVIYKATQGATGVDPTFASAEAKARAAGLWWGAYHFGTGGDGSDADGVTQAQHFLASIPHPEKTLLVLDFESNPTGPTMTLEQARRFVTHVQEQTGRWPGFYSGDHIKQVLLGTADPVLVNCWLWIAQYAHTPVIPPCWPTWTMWQYSDGAHPVPAPDPVPGFGHCDRSRFNGGIAQLEKLWPH